MELTVEWVGVEGSLELWTLEKDHTRYVTLGRGCGKLVFSLGHAGYSWRKKFSRKTGPGGGAFRYVSQTRTRPHVHPAPC